MAPTRIFANSSPCSKQEGQLLRIHDQVSLEPDLAAAACALAEIGENSPGDPCSTRSPASPTPRSR